MPLPPTSTPPRREPLVVEVRVRGVVRVLAWSVVLFAVAGAASAALRLSGRPTVYGFVNLFDLDIEMSAPTWFSAGVLLACAALLALLAGAAGRAGDPCRASWWLLTVGFAGMSLDEVAAYHESWIDRLRNAFDAGGIFYFAWVIPGSAVVAIVGLVLLPLLRSLPGATRRRFLAAATLFVAGALGMEMVNGWYVERNGGQNHTYAALVAFEELLEMVGAIAFLRALLLHLEDLVDGVRLDLGEA